MLVIGNTPLIRLDRLSGGDMADIYIKYEGANPTGSMKDRMALAMVALLPISPRSSLLFSVCLRLFSAFWSIFLVLAFICQRG